MRRYILIKSLLPSERTCQQQITTVLGKLNSYNGISLLTNRMPQSRSSNFDLIQLSVSPHKQRGSTKSKSFKRTKDSSIDAYLLLRSARGYACNLHFKILYCITHADGKRSALRQKARKDENVQHYLKQSLE